jgi:ribosomal protein S18 acetylase RimI-like enzyme
MSAPNIRLADRKDAKAIAGMLAQLAQELGDGDVFRTNEATIATYGFGAGRRFSCQIAEVDDCPVGLVLYYPIFSTSRGQPGAYVQDLWVSPQTRGHFVGGLLLGAVARHAEQAWQAVYLKLTSHAGNDGAIRFYKRLGFAMQGKDRPMILTGTGFGELLGAA